jgi:membrane-bound ClpP family serine protease
VKSARLAALLVASALLPAARAQDSTVEGLFVTVQNPITSDVTNRIKETTNRFVKRCQDQGLVSGKDRPRIVFDFNPAAHGGAAAPGSTRDFGPCQDLAEHIARLHDVLTIAFVHAEVSRHTVLPVLACKEIVMSEGASIGAVVAPDDLEPLARSKREAYREMLRGRCQAIVLKMLDRDMIVLRARRLQGGGVWYIDSRDKEAEARNGIVAEQDAVVGSGPRSTLYSAAQAREFELCQPFFRQSRQQVAAMYKMPAASLREDPLLGRNPIAWRIDVRGPVDGALAETLRRRIRRAIGQHANLLILQLECAGGDTLVARDLARDLRELKDDKGELPVMTVAYIPGHAPDTAVILALGCTEIVMHKDAELGDFSSLVFKSEGGELTEVDPDKNVMRLKDLKGLAEDQGYSPALFGGMMDRRVTIYWATNRKDRRERRFLSEEELKDDRQSVNPIWGNEVLIKEGGPPWPKPAPRAKLLILPADRAKEFGVARYTVDNLSELYALYGVDPSKVKVAEADWLDDLAKFLCSSTMSIILVMVGVTCLILELKMPGLGIPGVISALCFVLFFWSHSQLAGQITMLAILLFLLGLVLIGLEVFVIPGFGVCGISGVLLMLLSLALVTVEKKPETSQEWMGFVTTLAKFGLALLGAVPAALVVAHYLPSIPYVNRLILKPEGEKSEELGEETPEPIRPELAALLGAVGVAATPLRPAGKVQFGDDFVDVVAEGGYVVAGTRVQVVEIEGNRIVVKESV